jgi:hypothetical protein
MTQNMRGLPEVARDSGVVDDRYTYDPNGNVASIIDQLPRATASRTLDYDALDRLTTAKAPGLWGEAAYSYDVLDNIRSSTVGNRISSYDYKAKNLLDTINSTASGFSYAFLYDARGNVTRRGTQDYVFDLGNRMSRATGLETYVYDGFGRRVQTSAANGGGEGQFPHYDTGSAISPFIDLFRA